MNVRKMAKLNTRKGIWHTILLSLAVTAGVLLTGLFYVKGQLQQSAERNADNSARHILERTRDYLEEVSRATDNFMSPFVYWLKMDSVRCMAIEEVSLNAITTCNSVFAMLEGYVDNNPRTRSISYVFAPASLIPESRRAFAPRVYREGFRREDLSARGRQLYESGLYRRGDTSRVAFFSAPEYRDDPSTSVITYVQPVRALANPDKTVRQIWVEVELDGLCRLLEAEKPYENASICLFDSEGNVVASDDQSELGLSLADWNPIAEPDCFQERQYRMDDLGMTLAIYLPVKEVYASIKVVYLHMFVAIMLLMTFLSLGLLAFFRIYVREEKANIHTGHELKLAADIQKGFLPNASLLAGRLELYATSEPAAQVGGDFYDYLERNGKLYFCLGDVSGKGVPAAIFMSMTGSLFRAAARLSDSPAEIASIMNDALAERNEEFMFCTFFVGVIDPETGQIRFCNAGHNPPMAFGRPGGDTHFIVSEKNPPLGLYGHCAYVERTDELLPGQLLFVYSDGVTEARDTVKALFGDDRLMDILSALPDGTLPQQCISRVRQSLADFSAGAPQSDDITMLCIWRKP